MAREKTTKQVTELALLLNEEKQVEEQYTVLESLALQAGEVLERVGIELISENAEECVEGLEWLLDLDDELLDEEDAEQLRAVITKMREALPTK